MSRPIIDLRSDTVTRPSPGMIKAMMEAEVGDDVLGEDPTVNRLQEMVAKLLGKEAALFVPTGTMANQIAIGVHGAPGEELICDHSSHVYVWEGGGIARLSGITTRPLPGHHGLIEIDQLRGTIRPDDCHYARTRIVSLENTHNRGGGRIHPLPEVAEISGWARGNGLVMHLDGARLMNAVVATAIPAHEWARYFDTVAICFSKGLGTPVGSAIVGSEAYIAKAHRLRKVFGGGMRQAGYLAAAAIYALENNVERLADDHANAQILAQAVQATDGLSLETGHVHTNLVWIEVDPKLGTAADVAALLRGCGVLVSALGKQVIRACTHLDVSREQIEFAADLVRTVPKELKRA